MRRPALYILIPFALGIAVSGQIGTGLFVSLAAAAVFAAASAVFSSAKNVSHAALYIAVFFLGASSHINSNLLPPDHVSRFAGAGARESRAVIRGTVEDDPVVEAAFSGERKISFTLSAAGIKQRDLWQKSEGLVRAFIYTRENRSFEFGDEVVLEGFLSKPSGLKNPGLFDYAKRLANGGIYCILTSGDRGRVEVTGGLPANPVKRAAYRIRRAMRSALDRRLDGPDAAFAKAMLIGDRSSLGDDLNDEFIKTGTVHILSISGLHVGLIAGMALFVFGIVRIPKKASLIMTMAFLAVYSYVAGSSPPIIRAVVMFAVFAVGYVIERQTDLLNSLALAALFILLGAPKQLFDPGFQLSFVSIASIFIFYPKIGAALGAERHGRGGLIGRAAGYALKGVSVSVAAWIGTWPLISSYFNIVSPVSIIANLVIIPMSFLSMMGAIALILAGCVHVIVPAAIAHGLVVFNGALFAVNHALSRMPLAFFRTPALPGAWMAAYYALVVLWAAPPARPSGSPSGSPSDPVRPGLKKPAAITLLIVLNILMWERCADRRDILKATFLDVGKGDSAFVEFPGGWNCLIDAGPGAEPGRFDAGRNVVAPYIWNEGAAGIGALVITHPHADHLGGAIYILKNFTVGAAIDSGRGRGDLYGEYLRLLREKRVKRFIAGQGDAVVFPGGSKMYVLGPDGDDAGRDPRDDANAGSLVGKFVYENTAILFTGDAAGDAIGRMITRYGSFLRSDILKAPHHGGDIGGPAVVSKLEAAVSPSDVITSAGAPARREKAAGNYLTFGGAKEYYTYRDGALTVYIKPSGYDIKKSVENI